MILAVDGDVNRLFFPFFLGSFLVKHILQQVQVSTPEEREGAAAVVMNVYSEMYFFNFYFWFF